MRKILFTHSTFSLTSDWSELKKWSDGWIWFFPLYQECHDIWRPFILQMLHLSGLYSTELFLPVCSVCVLIYNIYMLIFTSPYAAINGNTWKQWCYWLDISMQYAEYLIVYLEWNYSLIVIIVITILLLLLSMSLPVLSSIKTKKLLQNLWFCTSVHFNFYKSKKINKARVQMVKYSSFPPAGNQIMLRNTLLTMQC